MKIGKHRKLFNIVEIQNYISKFESKLQESDTKINQLKADIDRADTEINVAMEKDILEGTASSKKELNNTQARKSNLESQVDAEMNKVLKIKEIMTNRLSKLIPQASKQISEDLKTFNNVVEKEIYRQLQEIREKQEELLLILQASHNMVINETSSLDEICSIFGFDQYKIEASNQMFHNNLFMPNRVFPQYGSPLINCSSLTAIEDVFMRSRAQANAIYNIDRERMGLENEQLPLSKELKDVDLDVFLKGLESYE